ncbi:MAG: Gfo/Idh/MocA family oxidoreductase [Gemmataceae bacterium]|nr:Gfo/Idh/MocA family oxidoreductase [Gemmataceae bacterium]
MSRRVSRRRFLQASSLSAAAAGFWLTAGVTESHARQNDPLRRLNVAVIGAGGQGGGNLGNVARTENIVALCDVDQARAAKSFNAHPNAAKFADFRVMLDRQRDIEAVVVSTPDHVHAHASIMAMRMGKHCYTEKPLTHSVWESRQMKLVARANRVATQMGNQGTSNTTLRQSVEIVRAGTIGEVREVHVWTNRPIWPQNIGRPAGPEPVPATLNWDLWNGPAAERPYSRAYVPFAWRGWWDFGTGALGDMACHTMNMPYMALSLGAPTAISADIAADGRAHMNETPPMGCTVTYEFPARGNMPACRLYWYERRTPPRALFLDALREGQNPSGSGMLLVGSRGTIYSDSDYGGSRRLLPTANFADYQPPEPTLPRSPGHHAEWLRACKGGPAAMSNFVDYAGPLSEMVLLGNVAMRTGGRLEWDSTNLRVTNNSAAAQYVHREYRRGWELTGERAAEVVQATHTAPAPATNQRPARFPILRRILGRDR